MVCDADHLRTIGYLKELRFLFMWRSLLSALKYATAMETHLRADFKRMQANSCRVPRRMKVITVVLRSTYGCQVWWGCERPHNFDGFGAQHASKCKTFDNISDAVRMTCAHIFLLFGVFPIEER